jgi:hypothetical protein
LPKLEAADRVSEEQALRAALDTWRQATLESDGPARCPGSTFLDTFAGNRLGSVVRLPA